MLRAVPSVTTRGGTMEPNSTGNDLAASGAQGDANEFSGSGSTQQQNEGFDFGGTTGNSSTESSGFRDRAKNVIGNAGEKLADVGASVRERTGVAKDRLAD